jgi:hypothetical protein
MGPRRRLAFSKPPPTVRTIGGANFGQQHTDEKQCCSNLSGVQLNKKHVSPELHELTEPSVVTVFFFRVFRVQLLP